MKLSPACDCSKCVRDRIAETLFVVRENRLPLPVLSGRRTQLGDLAQRLQPLGQLAESAGGWFGLRPLAAFQYEIFNVFENGVMVTRREQQNLRRMADRGRLNLSSAALAFITNPL